MGFKKLNTFTRRWEYIQPYMHNGEAWEEVFRSENEAAYRSSMFIPGEYIGAGTILQRDISNMPVVKDSPEFAQFMDTVSPFQYNGARGSKTSLNTSAWGTQPIHAYLVDSTHPDTEYKYWYGGTTGHNVREVIDAYLTGPVPSPSWAVPAQNGDRGIAVYDVGTGIMRELFMGHEVEKDGRIELRSGACGVSVNTPGLQNLATDNYALQQTTGLSNVAGMHNSLGFIGISEAIVGEINHALCFTTATMRMTYDDRPGRISWPSRGADGKLEHAMPGHPLYKKGPGPDWRGITNTPTHGQWGRVKADYDPEYNHKTGKKNGTFLQMVIRAAQKWGIVATDTNMWCHAFNAEQGRSWANAYGGKDPWDRDGLIGQIHRDPYRDEPDISVDGFPWDQTEWAPIDWGRPNPDYNIRPGGLTPWFGE